MTEAASRAPAAAGPAPSVPAPLFRDPVFDGATDPTVIRHHLTGEWWMFYTQRRASVEEPGVAWVHGSRIGIARSPDALHWRYAGVVDGLDDGTSAPAPNTHWAPEVIFDGSGYRMYLSIIDGVPEQWAGHERHIVEYRSGDLQHWCHVGRIALSSRFVIDACVARCPDGLWRLWYKDEADESTTWAASSADLEQWSVEGRVIAGRPHEGPNVFALGGWWWMLVDEWRGLGVHRSDDAVQWRRQGGDDVVILGEPGTRTDDATFGRHGDVVVSDDGRDAVLYYFTHPHWTGSELGEDGGAAARMSAIQRAWLSVDGGVLHCHRDGRGND